jgi:hypothetical protein
MLTRFPYVLVLDQCEYGDEGSQRLPKEKAARLRAAFLA